jgi:hypothetical protein
MPTAIEQIYDQIAQVLGGTNPNQLLSMVMPGTSLDASAYAYDTTQMKPATVEEAESRLTDQMFDLAKVSGSSNGQRVSSQFLQALSVLTPNFNYMMPVMKDTLRDFLNTLMPNTTTLDGKPFVGTLQEYYFKLYDNYIAVKQDWEKRIVAKKNELASDPTTENEKYLEWYEQIAEGELLKIDEALGKVLAVFSPADMDAILGALAAGPGGEIQQASNTVKDIQLASPNGGFFYPVSLTPADWFLDLASDLNPANLLKDPEFIAATITTKRQALLASISQVQAMLNEMPTKGDIKAAAESLQNAQSAYVQAQNNLLNTYADNTVAAVNIYLEMETGGAVKLPDDEIKTKLDEEARKVSKAKGEQPLATAATLKGGLPITAADVQKLLAGQQKLITAQSTLQTSSQALADAGMNLASQQASYFGDLPVVLARMQAQLADLTNQQNNLSTAVSAAGSTSLPVLAPVLSPADSAKVKTVTQAATTAAGKPSATAADVVAAVKGAVGTDPVLQPLLTAATQAGGGSAALGDLLLALDAGLDQLSGDDVAVGQKMLAAAQTAAELPNATPATVLLAMQAVDAAPALDYEPGGNGHYRALTAATPSAGIQALLNACKANDALTPAAVLQAVNTAADKLQNRPPQVRKSDTSQRFMELQLSFSSSDMEASSASDSSFSQTSWSTDLFFGSASGSSSSSSAVTSKNSLDSSTEIQVAFKAAKVDIERDWLDPGVFKLSKDMSRLSTEPVSLGPLPTKAPKDPSTSPTTSVIDWSKVQDNNAALFPCFPVAFVVVKDVNITFKATESSLSAVQTVLDSKSAVGGGFLCFSASSSSASHSDHSAMSTKTQGTTISISMPGPQILAWYLELTPQDNSTVLSVTDSGSGTADINIIQFVKQLAKLKGQLTQPLAQPAALALQLN